MQAASLPIADSTAVLGAFGTLHLVFIFRGNELHPRDPTVRAAMGRVHPVITRQTKVWRAAKAFNASHSLGLIASALVYGHLTLWRPEVLAGSPFLLALGMSVHLAHLALAQSYFFSIPCRGVTVASMLFACGWAWS